ncbi:MAG: LytTR family transcriptional regulator DNA-binding domain-containing protein [Ignavibacteriaceae bacterium]|nr:LytTR family transcriptional regulator DNA-binding domain-containing protein [Ignavibacteriaceae bacterium]
MKNNITSIIIDDETLARELVKKYAAHHPNVEVVSECSNGFEAIKKINECKPDIIFLDIQMPKINGFEMLELLEDPPIIIFTTAYDQYALKAFEVNAVDYLLKPFSQERFDEALKKALSFLENKSLQEQKIKELVKLNEQQKEILERIVVKDMQNISIIPIDDVKYLEAQDDYVMIHTSNKKYLKQKTMRYFEEHLNPRDFIRVHRSYITAIKEIMKIELAEKETYQLILKDKKILPVSRSGYTKLKEILK